MMLPTNAKRVFLAVGNTDMRKSINGLSVLVERAMDLNPFDGDLFVFCNRRRNMIKILYWDKNGLRGIVSTGLRTQKRSFYLVRKSWNGFWPDWTIRMLMSV